MTDKRQMPSYFGNYTLFVMEKMGGANLTRTILVKIEASIPSKIFNVEGTNIEYNEYIYIYTNSILFYFKI